MNVSTPIFRIRLPARGRQAGVSLMEVLIALAVIMIGLVGMLTLMLNSIRFSQEANLRSTAVSLVYDVADRVRANDRVPASYVTAFADSPVATTNCMSGLCSGTQLAIWDLQSWKASLAAQLPSGQGQIERNVVNSDLTITLQWLEPLGQRQLSLIVAF